MCDVKYNDYYGLTDSEMKYEIKISDANPYYEKCPPGYEPCVVQYGDVKVVKGYRLKFVKYICRTCGNIFEWPAMSTSVPGCQSLHGPISALPDDWIERIFRDEKSKDT